MGGGEEVWGRMKGCQERGRKGKEGVFRVCGEVCMGRRGLG